MKKNFFFWMAAIVMLIMSSCQQEAGFGTEATVSFQVGTPEIATRAYSDGMTATVLQYAVYDENGTELEDLTVTNGEIHGSTTVNLQLTTGNTYSVIFWAAAPNAPYTVDLGAKTMTVNYNGALSNDENRDAFYKYHTFTVTGAQTEIIELRRPFAQLNIGTNDYEASEKAGYMPTKSFVKVTNIYDSLNLETGVVYNPVEVTYDYADIDTTEVFPVTGYNYLAMNYLLVDTAKEVINVEFGYTETDSIAAKTRAVGSVPVQRNHRTNIYGQLLTGDVKINVEIKPEYYEPAHEADALFLAAAVGGEVTLTEDVVLEKTLEIQSNVIINLNGKTISGNLHKNDGAVIKVAKDATAKFVGGTISSLEENGGSAIQNSGIAIVEGTILKGAPNANGSWPSYTVNNTGKLTIDSAIITSYHGAVASYGDDAVVTLNNSVIDMEGIPGFTSHGIYTYNNGKVIVNGGTYANKATDQGTSGASVINGAVTVNGGDFSGRIENYYGTPVLQGGSYSVNPKANFIAADYKALKISDNKYMIVPDNIDAYCNTENTNLDGVTYTGDAFASGPMDNTLWINKYLFGEDAAIKVVDKTYGAIIIENCIGNLKNDVITIDNTNNSVMILQNLDLTLAEGKKLIKSTNTIYQVFMANITINGEKQTTESIAQYLENVGWYQVVEEI